MGVAHNPGLVDDDLGRHPAQLEEVDLLFVAAGSGLLRVGKANEGQVILFPIGLNL